MTEFRLNRVFSNPLSRILLRTPLTPNHVTTLSVTLGISAGCFFALGTYGASLTGAFLYQLAVILDNCDGDIARAKKLGSVFGGWYDIFGDIITDLSLFGGVALGAWRSGVAGPVPLFAALCLSGALLHLSLVILEKLRGFGPAVHAAPHPEHGTRKNVLLNIFDCLREGDSSWFVVIFALAGRTEWLLWAGGVYMQALWLSAFVLNFRWLFLAKKI